MNAAAGSIGLSPLVSSQPTAMDGLGQDSLSETNFSVALAAAVAPAVVGESMDAAEFAMPEGMQSDAALAWIAGLLSAEVPRRDVPLSSAELSAGLATGTAAPPQLLAADALIAAADFAAELMAAATGDAASDARAAVAPILIRSPGTRSIGDPSSSQVAGPLDPASLLGLLEDDQSKSQAIPFVTRLLNAFPDQAAAHGTAVLPMDAPAPALYTNSREAYVANAVPGTVVPESLRQPVSSPRWESELGTRLMLMSVRGQQEGSLSLTPEHLGPLEIRISMSQDTTNVWFGAQHADTRAALTDAMPRLREMFAASGLALGHAGVSHEMPRHEARQAEASALAAAGGPDDTVDMAAVSPTARRLHAALVDTWA
jgi:flagellar hook-length control protein FliK